MDRLLALIGSENLYGSSYAAIRELLQNAFDAVREKIAYARLKTDNPGARDHEEGLGNSELVSLHVFTDDDNWWLECRDTGVGMTKRIIETALLRNAQVGRGEIRTLQRKCREAGFELGRTGQFGIGVLSYFMLADQVTIITRRSPLADSNGATSETLQFTVNGLGDFGELKVVAMDKLPEDGTSVRFRLRKDRFKNIKTFVTQLTLRIIEFVARTPCRFELLLPIADGGTQSTHHAVGWLRDQETAAVQILKAWEQRKFPDMALWPPFGNSEERDKEKLAYEQSRRKMRWLERETLVLGGKVMVRIRLPIFEEADGLSLGSFLFLHGQNLSQYSQHIGCYLITPPFFHGSWKGINAAFEPTKGLDWNELFSDRTVIGSAREFAHPFLIEADILDAPQAVLSADRASFRASKAFEDDFVTAIRREIEALLRSNATLFDEANPYADFNRWCVGRSVQGAKGASWFIRRDGEVRFEAWSFPFTTGYKMFYSPYKRIEYRGNALTTVADVRSIVGTKAFGHFPPGDGLEFREPDRMCFYSLPSSSGADDETGFWPLWVEQTQWIGCRFPDVWASIAGVKLGWRELIWNRQNPIVNLAGFPPQTDLGSLRWHLDDREFIEHVLSSPSSAAQAILCSGFSSVPSGDESRQATDLWNELWHICAAALGADVNNLRFGIGEKDSIEWHSMRGISKLNSLKRGSWPEELGPPTDEAELISILPD